MTMTDSNTDAQAFADATIRSGKDAREVSEEIGLAARKQIDEIKADSRLSPQAKDDDVKAIANKVNARRAALGKAFEAQLESEAEGLRRKLLSPPETFVSADRILQEMSFRDALRSAHETSTSAELMGVFRSAQLNTDTLQQRAALTVALERGQPAVLEAWLAEHPGEQARFQRLVDLEHEISSQQRFHRSLQFVPTL